MIKVVVKARNEQIRIISEQGFEVESTRENMLRIGRYEIFLSVKGRGKEIEKIKNAIKETKKMMKEIKQSIGFCEKYYDLSRQLKHLRERKRELMNTPKEELDEIVVEFLYSEGQLRVVYNGESMEADEIYQELFLSGDLITSLFIVIVR
jgi:hypothetical protein